MGKRLTIILITILLTVPLDLSGGSVPTKSHSLWQLYQYKYTTLLRQKPLIYAPYKAYTLIDRYVSIYGKDNQYWISVDADIASIIREDAEYNRKFAKRFPTKKSRKKQVRKIFDYCRKTKYVAHVKYARDVFSTRTGDCAAIASAFYVLCKVKRIPVRYVIGWVKTGCHAWNRVKIGKKWYWIDATTGRWLSRKQFKNRTVMEIW